MTRPLPVPTGDDLPLCMAHILAGMGADLQDEDACVALLIGGDSRFLSREINAHVGAACDLARDMRRDPARPLFVIVKNAGGEGL